ncbi:MAG: serine/threonine protein kinase [Deltaproteobacteria bacterium]|nr:serine/threonine protein kinase [Deltaproteobacteria bacterium]
MSTAKSTDGCIGRYRLVKRLAVGGMADLYLAQQLGERGYERTVVVKTIRADLVEEEDLIQMLMEEARIASCLRHENIVELYEVGEERGTQFLAMEFLFGQDLSAIRDHCQEHDIKIPHQHIVTIVSDILSALHYAHHEATYQGQPLEVIHRDVSPQNVIVGFDGTVKLLDFGLAKAAAQISRTRAGVLKGKYAYMSPEQVNFKVVDHRADIFSAGILLWELLTQQRLFFRSSDYETVRAVMSCDVASPRAMDPEIPWNLSWVAYRALRKTPWWRYSSAGEMRKAILRSTTVSRDQAKEDLAEWMSQIFAPKLGNRDLLLSRARTKNPARLQEIRDAGFELLDEVTDPQMHGPQRATRDKTRDEPTSAAATCASKRTGEPSNFVARVVGTWKWFILVAAALSFLGVSMGVYIGSRGATASADQALLEIENRLMHGKVLVDGTMLDLERASHFPINPGKHQLTTIVDGRSTTIEIEVEAGEKRVIHVPFAQ